VFHAPSHWPKIHPQMIREIGVVGGENSASVPRMIDDPDILRAAKLLIDQHGEDAPMRAARRPDELLEGAMRTELRSGAKSWWRSAN
jgi:hypothetical protein